jgi:hypothetical protein
MSTQILFRSIKSGQKKVGTARNTVRVRWSDWSYLRPYTDTDDIRDIAWGRMRPEWLSVRERADHGDYHILSYLWHTPYDDFYIDSPGESRTSAIQKSQTIIEMSARFAGYQYDEYTRFDHLIKMKPKNTLIFISGDILPSDIWLLAYHNDLIYLDFIHPFEIYPRTDIMFSWQVIKDKKYIQEYQKIQDIKKNTIKKMQASYISLLTTADVSDVLNTFFKKRYTNG